MSGYWPIGAKEQMPESDDGMLVPHFEAKARITDYLAQSGLPHTVSCCPIAQLIEADLSISLIELDMYIILTPVNRAATHGKPLAYSSIYRG